MRAVIRSTSRSFLSGLGLICLATQVYAATPTAQTEKAGTQGSAPQASHWETDAAVRQGMSNIQHAMRAAQDNIETKRLSAADYQRLGKTIDQNVADFLTKRQLPKEAEKSFHLVVMTDLTHAAELMRSSPKVELQRAAALGVLKTLQHYGTYFQHPGWPQSAAPSR